MSLAEIEAGADVSNVKSAIDDTTYHHELMQDFKLPTGEIMLGRIRHFSAGMEIGSKQFLKEAYAKYGGEIIVNGFNRLFHLIPSLPTASLSK